MKGSAAADDWRSLLEVPPLARPFIKALSLVRDLSPRWKVAHFPALVTDDTNYLVYIQHALGELVSLTHLKGPIANYFVLRQLGGKDIFFGGTGPSSPAIGGTLQFTSPVPFSRLNPEQIRRGAAQSIKNLETKRGS